MSKKKYRRPKSELKIIMDTLHMYGCCRFWTTSVKGVTHAADVSRNPDSPDAVAGIFIKCETEDEAKQKAIAAKAKKQWGKCFYYISPMWGTAFGYAVHFPRFESERGGFINFHCFEAICEIPKGTKFDFLMCDDQKRYRKNILKKKV